MLPYRTLIPVPGTVPHTGVMRNKYAMFGAWLAATVLAVIVASAAVGAVRSGVTDQPSASAPFFGAADTVTTSTTTEPPTSTTTRPPEAVGSTTTTVDTGSTPTEPTGSSATTPTTTIPEAQTTTTTSGSFTKTYTLVGGRVTISASDPSVTFISAIPNAGFSVDLESSGPNEVKVEFDSEDHESEFTAKWHEGELLVDIDESD